MVEQQGGAGEQCRQETVFHQSAVLHDLDKAVDLATDGVEEEEEVLFALVDVIFLSLADELVDKM